MTGMGSPTEKPPRAKPSKGSAVISARWRRRSSRSAPPWTMPKRRWPSGRGATSAALRPAGGPLHGVDDDLARSVGGRQWSKAMAMSEPRVAWICIETSGVSVRGEPSTCERKVTPSSVSLASCESEKTWKPPESVSMGRGQPTSCAGRRGRR